MAASTAPVGIDHLTVVPANHETDTSGEDDAESDEQSELPSAESDAESDAE